MKTNVSRFFLILFFTLTVTVFPSSSCLYGKAPVQKTVNRWPRSKKKTAAWVRQESRPNKIKHGLDGRHIALWASHGRYYDKKKQQWQWQRPFLFSTTEDLYTQTIVVPFLMPMLENAGAIVFSPRERDWQTSEIIIDNDTHTAPYFFEITDKERWATCQKAGFAQWRSIYHDGENPFTEGTARQIATTKSSRISAALYQPNIAEEGRYAVYVSYQTMKNSVDDAEYVVNHKGQQAVFRVNQQMGGGTWVYLGTFDFGAGCSQENSVMLTNRSKTAGVVTTDAVRFGGGMGNIERGGETSHLPRALEGARYYSQWAGAPYAVYSSKGGSDDYSDDINVRSLFTNYLAGGSCFVPEKDGLGVPIELSLAVHSDAGYKKDGRSIVGTLSICTINHNDGRLNSGLSRSASTAFADLLLTTITSDLQQTYGQWTRRDLWDRNYSETRLPEVPSAIIETLSHQSFPDMRYGQDPTFRFTLARSIYKAILRVTSRLHGQQFVVSPLPPDHFRIEKKGEDKVVLQWKGVRDKLEPSARPTAFKVYTAIDGKGFDNGKVVKNTSLNIKLSRGHLYDFKVTAINDGGESFPTQVLSACITDKAAPQCLIIDGFQRLASPQVIDDNYRQGFDLDSDPGVSYGLTAGWSGRQRQFDKSQMGKETTNGLGYSGNEMAGQFVAGNDFNYVSTHAQAIKAAGNYNIISCSREAFEANLVSTKAVDIIDLVLGLERNDGYSLRHYKTFTPSMINLLTTYLQRGGRLIASGAYLGSDMTTTDEQAFLQQYLNVAWGGTLRSESRSTVIGMNTTMDIYSELNPRHYAATSVDVLQPAGSAICAMQYADGTSAAVGCQAPNRRTFVMGFPFECIREKEKQAWAMKAILSYLK